MRQSRIGPACDIYCIYPCVRLISFGFPLEFGKFPFDIIVVNEETSLLLIEILTV